MKIYIILSVIGKSKLPNLKGTLRNDPPCILISEQNTLALPYLESLPYLTEFSSIDKSKHNKTGVINDPLGQPTVPAGSDCRLILKFWDGRMLCVKIVITTGRDCGRPRGSRTAHVLFRDFVYMTLSRS